MKTLQELENEQEKQAAAICKNQLTNVSQVTYDVYGRMKYHPDYHAKQGTPWSTTDQSFLIENYESMGPEGISFALERTVHTVMTRAYELRKKGLMPKRSKSARKTKRTRSL